MPGGAVRRAGALHVERLGGDVLRAARGARLPPARQDPEVRGRLPRHPRLRADERQSRARPRRSRRRWPTPPASRTSIEDEVLIAPYNDLGHDRGAHRRAPQRAGRGDRRALPAADRAAARLPPGLREITQRYGVPLVFDEIVTGFRLAYGGAQEYYGVVPDLAAFGKIVAGGFPLGRGRAAAAEIMRHFDPALEGSARLRVAGRHAERQPGGGRRPAWPPWPSCASPAPTSGCSRTGARLQGRAGRAARKHGLAAQVGGEPPVFDILFTDRPVVDYRAAADRRSPAHRRSSRRVPAARGGEGLSTRSTCRSPTATPTWTGRLEACEAALKVLPRKRTLRS